jgi:hydrogenase nickel insertion protein HypA
MHEASMVRSLLTQVVEAGKPRPASSIRKVVISIGPLSGVESLLVSQSYQDQRADFGLDFCELEIEDASLEGQCLECLREFEIKDFVFICPSCNSASVQVTTGDGVFLLRLEVDELEPAA